MAYKLILEGGKEETPARSSRYMTTEHLVRLCSTKSDRALSTQSPCTVPSSVCHTEMSRPNRGRIIERLWKNMRGSPFVTIASVRQPSVKGRIKSKEQDKMDGT